MRLGVLAACALATVGATQSPGRAAVITSGNLNVTVNDSNGALSSVMFNGVEYYQRGTAVSDFGFQLGTNANTFSLSGNDYGNVGNTGVSLVTGTPAAITVTGTYNGIDYTRTYSITGDVLRTSSTFTNTTGAAQTLRAYEGFDPDQGLDRGNGFDTANDALTLGGISVNQSSETSGYTVVMGGVGAVTGFNFFAITNGSDLNTFFGAPFDPNGAVDDTGSNIGFQLSLAPGQTSSLQFDQAFGTTPEAAQAAFLAAQATPEPATCAAFGLMGVAGLGYVRRRLKGAPVAA